MLVITHLIQGSLTAESQLSGFHSWAFIFKVTLCSVTSERWDVGQVLVQNDTSYYSTIITLSTRIECSFQPGQFTAWLSPCLLSGVIRS